MNYLYKLKVNFILFTIKVAGEKDKEESEIFGTPGNKTRKGATAGGSGITGVNRRTAVLFTRKKAATKEEEGKADKKRTSRRNDESKSESADEAQSTPNKKGSYFLKLSKYSYYNVCAPPFLGFMLYF